jgi:sec-independent protein translocase protein TatA
MPIYAFDVHAISSSLLAFGMPGGWEWVILLVLGLLVFGRRLPEVGRSLGRGIVEFKKGIRGIEEEIDEETAKPTRRVDNAPRQELPNNAADSRQQQHNPYAAVEQPREQ